MFFGLTLTVLIVLLAIAVIVAVIGYAIWLTSPRKKNNKQLEQETGVKSATNPQQTNTPGPDAASQSNR